MLRVVAKNVAYIYFWVVANEVETESLWSVVISKKNTCEYVRLVLKTRASAPNHFKRFVTDALLFVTVVNSGKEEGIKSHLEMKKARSKEATSSTTP